MQQCLSLVPLQGAQGVSPSSFGAGLPVLYNLVLSYPCTAVRHVSTRPRVPSHDELALGGPFQWCLIGQNITESRRVTIYCATMSESLEERFKKAVWLIRNGPKMESSNEQKLTFYSFFKQACA